MLRGLRMSGWFVLAFATVFILFCCIGEIRQRLLIHRAGKLLSDIHSLRLNESTWNDAQRMMTRWGRWGHYDGSCTSTECVYVITLNGSSMGANNVAEWPSRTDMFFHAFRLLPRQWGRGLRQLQAMLLVQDGVIKRSGLAIDMTESPLAKGAQPACCGAELIISVVSRGSLFGEWEDEESSARHPDYEVWHPGGCTFCLMGRVTYPATMPWDEAARLSDFRLSCATRWSSCLTLEQLDPSARDWRLYGPPWGEAPDRQETTLPHDHCAIPLYARARDSDKIFTVDAAAGVRDTVPDWDGTRDEVVPVRLLSVSKGTSPWVPGTFGEAIPYSWMADRGAREPSSLAAEQRYILLLSADSEKRGKVAGLGICQVVPDNAMNRQDIKKGMALDDPLKGDEEWISLSGFHRGPRIPLDR